MHEHNPAGSPSPKQPASTATKNSGFTIIEVVIVLALAAFIFTIVFFAVPQLQRSLRNNQRSRDLERTAAALLEFKAANDGQFPGSQSDVSRVAEGLGGAEFRDTAGRQYFIFYRASLSYSGTHTGTYSNPTGRDIIIVHPDAECADTTSYVQAKQGSMAVKLHTETGQLPPNLNFFCQDV